VVTIKTFSNNPLTDKIRAFQRAYQRAYQRACQRATKELGQRAWSKSLVKEQG
jgi:hypothetical protein